MDLKRLEDTYAASKSDLLLHIITITGETVSINPLNVVLIREQHRSALEHTTECTDRAAGEELPHDTAVWGWCSEVGCVRSLPPLTEILLVNTIGPSSSIVTPASARELEQMINQKLSVMLQHPITACRFYRDYRTV